MKSAHVGQFATLTGWGGVERMLLDLLLHVSQQYVRHSLVTTSSRPEIVEVARGAGIPCFQPAGCFRYQPDKLLQMARWLDAEHVQLIHSYNAFANAWANLTTLMTATAPVLITGEHGTIWNTRPPIAWLDRWAHSRARLVIANSRASARMLALKYGIPARKIRVVRNGVPRILHADLKRVRRELGLRKDTLVVGSVGRLDTTKDYGTLVEAAQFVVKTRQDVVFVLIGGGPLEVELRARVVALGIQDRFLMTGWRADARDLMQVFDVLVSTSIRETFGNVLIEAALCGIPAIAPAIDGVPEAVLHGHTGILLRPSQPVRQYRSRGASPPPSQVLIDGKLDPPQALDPRELSQILLRVLADIDLRVKLGTQARKRAETLFSMDRYIRELESIYLDILSEGRTDAGLHPL